MRWAKYSPLVAPTKPMPTRRLARNTSIRLEIWKIPCPATTGPAFRATIRASGSSGANRGRSDPASRRTAGSWTATWSAPPASVDHARTTMSGSHPSFAPAARPPICARFQTTGAANGRKNRR